MKTESEIKSSLEAPAKPGIRFWRIMRPVVDPKVPAEKTCALVCPHNAIAWLEAEKKIKIDYNLCDGCLVCLRECHSGAIKEEREK
jgi:2-oxoacid:acceptor oxidoreductase delta subunit (pyruvate/2-ketoisovalerate family)